MNRQARLEGFFKDAVQGKRAIRTLEDAHRFFDGASFLEPSRAAAMLVDPKGITALETAVTCDLTPLGVRCVLSLVGRLSDESIEFLGGGLILKKIVMAIVKAPLIWQEMLVVARTTQPHRLTDKAMEALAWLAVYIVRTSFEDEAFQSFAAQVEEWYKDTSPKEADPGLTPAFHTHWRKLSEMLQMRSSGDKLPSSQGITPGGRHDNDFADFRKIVILPTADELQCAEPPFYRRWAEVEAVAVQDRPSAHLDNMYRLLREDMLVEIRQELQNAFRGKQKGTKRMTLDDLTLREVLGPKDRDRKWTACSLIIQPNKGLEKFRKLDADKRKAFLKKQPGFLKHQSFAALCQNTSVIAFGYIVRDEDMLCSDAPTVGFMPAESAAFGRALAAFTEPRALQLLIVDAPVFAYQPVLARLKAMADVPLAECLLDPDHVPDLVPVSKHLTPVVSRLRVNSINFAQDAVPVRAGPRSYNLDESQFSSLLNALTDPVSIIQGPPGTCSCPLPL